jgi:hypothetical protein
VKSGSEFIEFANLALGTCVPSVFPAIAAAFILFYSLFD